MTAVHRFYITLLSPDGHEVRPALAIYANSITDAIIEARAWLRNGPLEAVRATVVSADRSERADNITSTANR